MRGILTERTRQLGLEGVVLMPGEQKEIPTWLAAFDIFCLPSLWEGLPNALLEAMALGIPVVASKVDGVPEAVAADITGLLCEPKDSQSLYIPLQDLIADPALRKKLGGAAAQVIQQNFTITTMVRAWEEACRRVLGSSSS